jgi:hypothetical protein
VCECNASNWQAGPSRQRHGCGTTANRWGPGAEARVIWGTGSILCHQISGGRLWLEFSWLKTNCWIYDGWWRLGGQLWPPILANSGGDARVCCGGVAGDEASSGFVRGGSGSLMVRAKSWWEDQRLENHNGVSQWGSASSYEQLWSREGIKLGQNWAKKVWCSAKNPMRLDWATVRAQCECVTVRSNSCVECNSGKQLRMGNTSKQTVGVGEGYYHEVQGSLLVSRGMTTTPDDDNSPRRGGAWGGWVGAGQTDEGEGRQGHVPGCWYLCETHWGVRDNEDSTTMRERACDGGAWVCGMAGWARGSGCCRANEIGQGEWGARGGMVWLRGSQGCGCVRDGVSEGNGCGEGKDEYTTQVA